MQKLKTFRRFSCRVCIYSGTEDIKQIAKHDPEAIDIIDSLERDINFTIKPEGSIRAICGK